MMVRSVDFIKSVLFRIKTNDKDTEIFHKTINCMQIQWTDVRADL